MKRSVKRFQTHFEGESKTEQSHKSECEIDNIIAKHHKTGAVTHVNKHQPNYGNASGQDFLSAMLVVTEAQQMFQELPSNVRNKYNNDPAQFLDAVQDPAKESELVELGILPNRKVRTAEEPVMASTEALQKSEAASPTPAEPETVAT